VKDHTDTYWTVAGPGIAPATAIKFAKQVFRIAAIWGLLVVLPLFFLFDTVGRQAPPAITHPEFYYGFAAVTSTWQLAFLLIASDPERFRPLMPVAVVEKAGWLVTLAVLFAQDRVGPSVIPFGAVDMLLGVLFAVSFVTTAPSRPRLSGRHS
jgi:hypothetical protein